MRNLILITEKKLLQCTPLQWEAAGGSNMVVFSGHGSRETAGSIRTNYGPVFHQLHLFDNFEYNDRVEVEAVRLHETWPFEQVLCFSEINILRSSRIRKYLGLPGQQPEEAILFRNKFLMKELAQAHGIPCARFRKVRNALEILDFIDEVGYPLVVKPLEGRGSWETNIFKDEPELFDFLEAGGLSKSHRMPDMLAEEYIGGEMYMVDCLLINGEESFTTVAHLPTRPIEFLKGRYGSIYRLRMDHPDYQRMRDFAHHLIREVFPSPATSIFQVEIFDYNGRLYLCEIACRMGGVAFNEEVKLNYGFDLKLKYIEAMAGQANDDIGLKPKWAEQCVGWLVFPPQPGKLKEIKANPEAITDLLAFKLPGIEQHQEYSPAQLTNCEVATFIFTADDEEKAQHKVREIANWYQQNLEWEIA